MILGQRIRLDPNNVQTTFLERCAGAARRIWNVGLGRWQKMYEASEKPNWRTINAEVNARKNTDLAWLRELPWSVPNNALQDLGNAFSHFFRRVKAGEGKPGYPHFKKKGRCKEGFAIEGRALKFDGRKVKVPKLGWLHTRQELRFPGKILSARFTQHAGHWYVSIQVEVDETQWSYPHHCETQAVVGVDMGVKDLAVLDDAAINLRNLAAAHAVTACCPGSSGPVEVGRVKLPVGQESSICVNRKVHSKSRMGSRTKAPRLLTCLLSLCERLSNDETPGAARKG